MDARVVGTDEGERFGVLGHEMRLLLSGQDTGGAFSLFEMVTPSGVGIPPHRHEREAETFHVIAGRLEVALADRTLVAEPGATIHCPRGAVHSIRAVGDGPVRTMVHVAPAGAEHMFRALSALEGASPEEVAAVCERYGVTFVG